MKENSKQEKILPEEEEKTLHWVVLVEEFFFALRLGLGLGVFLTSFHEKFSLGR